MNPAALVFYLVTGTTLESATMVPYLRMPKRSNSFLKGA
jgi:hypothetical protein